jgi:UDPglucose 6-dehydrogenase
MSRICVVGAGYVGLTFAAFLASLGHDVYCADIHVQKVAALSRGEVPILERGLGPLVREGIASGRLSFASRASAVVPGCEFTFLCLPTPELPDGSADISSILAVADEIGPLLSSGSIVVNKSTVPIGSMQAFREALRRSDVAVAYNPEFLREGSALDDCFSPERIVIGTEDKTTAYRIVDLFRGISAPLVITDPKSAELIKYASNAFLATKVSFINSIANLCEAVGVDVSNVVAGIGYDQRIGFGALQPGPGWGGSCLPKDTRALVRIGDEVGYDLALLRSVIAVNDEQQERMVAKIRTAVRGSLKGIKVAIWGLTFKAGTNDCRDSPAIIIADRLRQAGAIIRVYDPTVRHPVNGMEVCSEPYRACQEASVLVVLTEWDELRGLDFDKVRWLMARPRIVDTRNLLDPGVMRRAGFEYRGIGRP